MRIAVSGGTGFVGRAIVHRLLEQGGHSIVVTSRDPSRNDPWHGRIELVQAFAGDPLSLGRAFTRADAVIHCLQFENHPVEDPGRGRTYGEIDGRGTAVAVRVARSLGVRRFVYLSGAGAGQGRSQPWFIAKDSAEAAIRRTGIERVILRPSWIHGPGDRSLNRIIAMCRFLPVVPVVGNGSAPVFPIHVNDVARCAVESIHREDAGGRDFDLGGPERLGMDQVIRAVQHVLGKKRPLLHQPVWLVKWIARVLIHLPGRVLSPAAVDFLTQSVEIDPRPAQEFFAFSFRRLEDALRDILAVNHRGTVLPPSRRDSPADQR